MMDGELHILQHSLGLDEYGQGDSRRNHFVTGPGCRDYDMCMDLVSKGFMTRREGSPISGGDPIFYVTPAGIDHVALTSPAPPPPPKLSRSQRNYQNFLDADSGLSFREWMGFDRKRQAQPSFYPF